MDTALSDPESSDLGQFQSKAKKWILAHRDEYLVRTEPDPTLQHRFRQALWDAGLLGIQLDPAYGGQGLTPEHQRIFDEEFSGYSFPSTSEVVTTGICAPTLLDFGSEEQKRAHIPAMIRGDEAWTQLLSEPGAGSDLAGLQTKARRDGDEYVLTGQKVWTSAAMTSDFALCMARTDPTRPKHKGLSMLIVNLKAQGVTIRPIQQMTGDSHFNEVFLDDVHIPSSDLVGLENDGWRALIAMLTHERLALGAGTGAGGTGSGWSKPAADRLIEVAKRRGINGDPVMKQELVKLYIAERTLALMGQKLRDEIAAGIDVGSKGSIVKLATAQVARQAGSLGMTLAGPASVAWSDESPDGETLAHDLCYSPMTAIAGGTSEIQRNTVGERVLGLPREPQVDRDIAFADVLQNL